MIYKERSFWFLSVLVFCMVLGCGRDTDFLYHRSEPKGVQQSFVHSLKELQGNSKVDILFVVDNSPSMGSHQANLHKNATIFIDQFVKDARLDWRMGLVSTDVRDAPYVGMGYSKSLDFKSVDPTDLFKNAVSRLGISGSGIEQSFAGALKAIDDDPKFVRPGSTLAVIIVSDAVEQSKISGIDFVTKLRSYVGTKGQAIVYAVLANEDLKCPNPQEENYVYATSPYAVAIEETKGKIYTLCDDFGQSLAELGKDLVTRIERGSIALHSRPALNTIKLLRKGELLPGGPKEQGGYWQYDFDLNRIVFHSLEFAPDEDEQVTVEYETTP